MSSGTLVSTDRKEYSTKFVFIRWILCDFFFSLSLCLAISLATSAAAVARHFSHSISVEINAKQTK